MDTAVPILPSRDLAETATFYGRLGFELASRHPAEGTPSYQIMRRGTVELHFFAHPELNPAASDFMAYIRADDPDAWARQLAALDLPAAGIPRFVDIEDKPWGTRELALVDPDGTLIRIGRRLEIGDR